MLACGALYRLVCGVKIRGSVTADLGPWEGGVPVMMFGFLGEYISCGS